MRWQRVRHAFLDNIARGMLGIGFVITATTVYLIFQARVNVQHKRNTLCPSCNVILISVDTLRSDDLPCYGYSKDTAPNLCAFARKGTLFTNSYSQSPFTFDSHLSIMTSLYPSSHGTLDEFEHELQVSIPVLPDELRKNGYETIYVGPDIPDPTMPYAEQRYGFDKVFNTSVFDIKGWQKEMHAFDASVLSGGRVFMFLHTYYVHFPFLTGDPNDAKAFSGKGISMPVTHETYARHDAYYVKAIVSRIDEDIAKALPGEVERLRSIREAFISATDEKAVEQADGMLTEFERNEGYQLRARHTLDVGNPVHMRYLRALYDKRIAQFDRDFSSLIAWLSREGRMSKTIVILTSDHGEEFMEHGQLFHATDVYPEQTRVPLIVWGPGIKAFRSDLPVEGVDIYPTIFGLLGIKPPSSLTGRDLTPVLTGGRMDPRFLVSERHGDAVRAMREGSWDLYVKEDGSVELYDTTTDVEERHDVSAVYPDLVKRMRDRLENRIGSLPKYRPFVKVVPAWLDMGKRIRMERQGYFW